MATHTHLVTPLKAGKWFHVTGKFTSARCARGPGWGSGGFGGRMTWLFFGLK